MTSHAVRLRQTYLNGCFVRELPHMQYNPSA